MISKNQKRTIEAIRISASSLMSISDAELQRRTEDLRQQVLGPDRVSHQSEQRNLGVALALEAVRRVLGWTLYDVQLLAGITMTSQSIAEMQTGEGKTVSAVPAAVWLGILGRGVHIATPNTYLAKRDFLQNKPIFELLGLTCGLVGCDESDPSAAYACDVVYGPGYEFGFDYLRDQRWLKSQRDLPIGSRTLEAFSGQRQSQLAHRGLGAILVDEADHVLIDDAASPQVLSEFQPGPGPDEDAVILAGIVARSLRSPDHFYETASGHIKLTPDGIRLVHDSELRIPVDQLTRPWTTYIETAIRAAIQFEKDVDYVVREGKVKIVEQSTGRIFDDRSWQSGLHQAIEAKEGVEVTAESIPLAQITRQRFFRLYRHLTGMTGTIGNCRKELKTIYDLDVVPIPLRQTSKRNVLPFRLFNGEVSKWDAVVASLIQVHRQGRPVLIGTRTIRDSLILAARLDASGMSYQLLNGTQDDEEAEIVSLAGGEGAVTIATNLAGRGTDIKLTPEIKQRGGLHVIVSECHESYRADRQLMGRCGRQGDPGSCQTFVSVDDWLLQHHAPWLAEALQRESAIGSAAGEIDFPIESHIRSLQRRLENERFGQRRNLLEAENKRNEMLLRVRR